MVNVISSPEQDLKLLLFFLFEAHVFFRIFLYSHNEEIEGGRQAEKLFTAFLFFLSNLVVFEVRYGLWS